LAVGEPVLRGEIASKIRQRLQAFWAARRAPARTRALLRGPTPRRILVLCYGNIYRSPFVAACLRAALPNHVAVEVRSAGFHSVADRASPASFVELCRCYGMDLSAHRSTVIDESVARWADWIVIMDRRNWLDLTRLCPEVRTKVVWLGALDGAPVDIADPYGRPVAEVQKLTARLHRSATALGARLST